MAKRKKLPKSLKEIEDELDAQFTNPPKGEQPLNKFAETDLRMIRVTDSKGKPVKL